MTTMNPPPPPAANAGPSSPKKLPVLDPSTPHHFIRPAKRILEGTDVAHFLSSKAYGDIGTWVMQLNRAMLPRKTNPRNPVQMFSTDAPRQDPESVKKLQELLKRIEVIIEDAPLDPGPRRFGNMGFRTFHKLLEERAEGLLREFLPLGLLEKFTNTSNQDGEEAVGAMDEVKAYFLGGFGSSQRLDFGTGHELSFVAFLGCLWKLGVFSEQVEGPPGALERSIVLGVIEPYLNVIRRLILHYTLEPAGSHGVWGLDDHFFMPYILGSAQLSRPLTSEDEPTPLEGSAPLSPKVSETATPALAEKQRHAWLYFAAIAFINDVKKGPFWEHSPILYDISSITAGWGKVNKGMILMFNAEVLSKFPVVQHFPFGGLFSWDRDPNAMPLAVPTPPVDRAAPAGAGGTGMPGAGTAAPWAQPTRMPLGPGSIPPTPPTSFPRGVPGTASNQHSVTKAPWADSKTLKDAFTR